MNTTIGTDPTLNGPEGQALARSFYAVDDPAGLAVDTHEVLRRGRRARRRHTLGMGVVSVAPVLLVAGGLWATGALPQSVQTVLPAGPWACGPASYPSSIGTDMTSANLDLPAGGPQLVVAVFSCDPGGTGWLLAGQHTEGSTGPVDVRSSMDSSSEDAITGPLIVRTTDGAEVLVGTVSRTARDLQVIGRPDAVILREPMAGTGMDAFAVAGVTPSDQVGLAWREENPEQLHTKWSQALSRTVYGVDQDFETARLWVAQDRAEQWWVLGSEVMGPFGNEPWATVAAGPRGRDVLLTAALLPSDADNVTLDAGEGATVRPLRADEDVTPEEFIVVAHEVTTRPEGQNQPLTISWTDATGEPHELAVEPADATP